MKYKMENYGRISMNCVGIIAEYDPFHNGHAYHIAESKRLANAEHAIVVMSGSFVQRGAPACFDKYTRARFAVENGASMVIELPDVLSCACAERFAYGGVKLLASTGLCTHLSFGSESGDISKLIQRSNVELQGDELKSLISEGYSYPKAVSLYLERAGIESADMPNDLLGCEYLRQLRSVKGTENIVPIAVKRSDGGYLNTSVGDTFASASAIRKAVNDGSIGAIRSCVPEGVFSAMENCIEAGTFPAVSENLSNCILTVLRLSTADKIKDLADVSEGLENPILRAAFASSNTSELLDAVKTKRYTAARLRRILINALLGTTRQLQELAASAPDALYIRVLAVRKDIRRELLSKLAEKASLPIVTSSESLSSLSKNALSVYEHSRRAAAIRALACPSQRSAPADFPGNIVI